MLHVSRSFRALVFLLVCLASAPVLLAQGDDEATQRRRVVRVYYDDVSEISALVEFDLWEGGNRQERYVLVAVSPVEYERLQRLGLRFETDERQTAELNRERVVDPNQLAGIPGYPCYRTVEEAYATAAQMVVEHPDLAAWIDVGDSWEKSQGLGGYDLMVLKLTNSAVSGIKPKLFVTTSIHAREYAPAELNTRFAEYLIDGHGSDADATWLIDHHEIHLMFMANPDARKQAEAGLSWRKNTNQNYCSPTSDNRGADLNRNFEFQWGCCGGSSGSECNSLFRGPFPASEPETQAIESYLISQFPDQRDDPLNDPAPDDATGVYMDIHAAGDLVLWPWGFPGAAPNGDQLQTMGRKLAHLNGYWPEQGADFYPTDGSTFDFSYGKLGIASMAFELGTRFFQECSTFENTILPANLPALVYAAKVARTPYITPAGPDAANVQVFPGSVDQGMPLDLTAVIDDTRYNNSNGTEPTQTVFAAEYYVDVPPWASASPQAHALAPSDGSFDSGVEAVDATVATGALLGGRHILFVRGQDADGNWGAFSAAFFEVTDATYGTVVGTVTESPGGSPLAATVYEDSSGSSAPTDPVTGDYTLILPPGEWTLRAAAPDHVDEVVGNVLVTDGGLTTQHFALVPADDDDDGVMNLLDCLPLNPEVWTVPGPAQNLLLAESAIDNLGWAAPLEPGGVSVTYDLLRSDLSDDFFASQCIETDGSDTLSTDPGEPDPGEVYYYLVRARNPCGGNLGYDSFGTPRTGRTCRLIPDP